MKKAAKSETRRSRKARTTPHQALYDSFLRKLASAKEEVGLTQRDVSQRLGMSHSFLSKCETGDRRIDVMELIQLVQLYGKPPQYFLDPDPNTL